jgi:serine/threonine-protein kinase
MEDPAPNPPAGEPGRLTLITVPWSEVYLGGRLIGTTPLRGVEVPSGRQTFTLRNSEANVEMQVQLAIPAGGAVSRRLSLR